MPPPRVSSATPRDRVRNRVKRNKRANFTNEVWKSITTNVILDRTLFNYSLTRPHIVSAWIGVIFWRNQLSANDIWYCNDSSCDRLAYYFGQIISAQKSWVRYNRYKTFYCRYVPGRNFPLRTFHQWDISLTGYFTAGTSGQFGQDIVMLYICALKHSNHKIKGF